VCVCVFVCLSLTPLHSAIVSKLCKLGSRNIHYGCHKYSSFLCQGAMPLDKENFLEPGVKERYSLKSGYFSVVDSFSV